MDYKESDALLQGRCSQSRKLENNTYLQRRGSAIAVLLHSTDVLTFYPSGKVTVNTGGWNTVTTKDRINRYLSRPHRIGSERGQMILYSMSPNAWTPLCTFNQEVSISRNRKITGGGSLAKWKEQCKAEDREQGRLRYWVRKGRNGKANSKLTLAGILAETNVSIRLAQMHVYGLDRFLLEAGAETLDTEAGYALLRLKVSEWQNVTVLKMTCPSTGAVYVSPVEPRCQKVREALDWTFQTENYLDRVGAQA